MKKTNYFDFSDSYSYGLDFSKIKLELPKASKKIKSSTKKYVCIDLEMTEFQSRRRSCIPGANGEVIQFGAVMLDENFNMISKFSSYVKPVYSSVTPAIHELTGITNKNLEDADDFITVFDKFTFWCGEGDIITFCWSRADHNQLWCELEAKGRHRYDLFACLKDFVDLQKIFGNLISSKVPVSLESAMKLLQMDYQGQVHTALSDSFNTARILHKLFCTDSLDFDIEYINPNEKKEKTEYKAPKENYNCSFASFMSPELLEQFGWTYDEELEEDCYEEYGMEEDTELLESSPLLGLIDDKEINCLCAKYKIKVNNWLKLATDVIKTEEMLVA